MIAKRRFKWLGLFLVLVVCLITSAPAETSQTLGAGPSDRNQSKGWDGSAGSTQLTFSDDFDRPDGPVGNGWSTWRGNDFESPDIRLVDGELHTAGFPGLAGGIFRSLPVGLPLTFAFDFRTFSVRECSPEHESWSNDGGWLISFNGSPNFHPYTGLAQIRFYQYSGLRHVWRSYLTQSGEMFSNVSSPLQEPLPDQREFGPTPTAHIEGFIDSDLSAEIDVYYNDGLKPDPVVFVFQPAVGAASTPPGSLLVFGNSSCANGPHIFDNLEITYQSPQPK